MGRKDISAALEAEPGLSAFDLADKTGRSLSSIYRVLRTMERKIREIESEVCPKTGRNIFFMRDE